MSTNQVHVEKVFLRKFQKWNVKEVENQLQVGAVENAVKVNIGLLVMKDVRAQWLTALWDKLCSEISIVTNGFKNTGIVEAVQDTREHALLDEEEGDSDSCISPGKDKDPCESYTEADDPSFLTSL